MTGEYKISKIYIRDDNGEDRIRLVIDNPDLFYNQKTETVYKKPRTRTVYKPEECIELILFCNNAQIYYCKDGDKNGY